MRSPIRIAKAHPPDDYPVVRHPGPVGIFTCGSCGGRQRNNPAKVGWHAFNITLVLPAPKLTDGWYCMLGRSPAALSIGACDWYLGKGYVYRLFTIELRLPGPKRLICWLPWHPITDAPWFRRRWSAVAGS